MVREWGGAGEGGGNRRQTDRHPETHRQRDKETERDKSPTHNGVRGRTWGKSLEKHRIFGF